MYGMPKEKKKAHTLNCEHALGLFVLLIYNPRFSSSWKFPAHLICIFILLLKGFDILHDFYSCYSHTVQLASA